MEHTGTRDSMANGSKFDVALRIIDRLGFPAVVCLLFFVGIWKGSQWIAEGIIVPMTRSHLETLVKVQQSIGSQAQTLDRMANEFQTEREFSRDRTRLLQQIYDEQRKTTGAIEALMKSNP